MICVGPHLLNKDCRGVWLICLYNPNEENFFLADSLVYRYFHLPVITY